MKEIKEFERVMNGECYLHDLKCDCDLFYGYEFAKQNKLEHPYIGRTNDIRHAWIVADSLVFGIDKIFLGHICRTDDLAEFYALGCSVAGFAKIDTQWHKGENVLILDMPSAKKWVEVFKAKFAEYRQKLSNDCKFADITEMVYFSRIFYNGSLPKNAVDCDELMEFIFDLLHHDQISASNLTLFSSYLDEFFPEGDIILHHYYCNSNALGNLAKLAIDGELWETMVEIVTHPCATKWVLNQVIDNCPNAEVVELAKEMLNK